MITAWQDFYEQEQQRNENNPTAKYRARLMKKLPTFGNHFKLVFLSDGVMFRLLHFYVILFLSIALNYEHLRN